MREDIGWFCKYCGSFNVKTKTCDSCGNLYSINPTEIPINNSEFNICFYCGASIVHNSNYCSNCGKEQRSGLPANARTTPWEICNIILNFDIQGKWGEAKFRYVAKVFDPKGTYIVGETKWFNNINSEREQKKAREGLYKLVFQLINKGFQLVGLYGSHYFEYQFRRLLK